MTVTDDSVFHRYKVEGWSTADMALRVLNLFAQRDLDFDRVMIERVEDYFTVTIDHHTLPEAHARIILEKIRSMVQVVRADLTLISADRDEQGTKHLRPVSSVPFGF